MIEVFKTNIEKEEQAYQLTRQIQMLFPGFKVNFDLEDCDHILRVVYPRNISPLPLVDFINQQGFKIEVLPEHIPSYKI